MKIEYFDDTDSMIIDFERKEKVGEDRYIEVGDGSTLIWVDEAGNIGVIEIMSGASNYDLTGVEPYRGDAKAEFEAAVKAAKSKR